MSWWTIKLQEKVETGHNTEKKYEAMIMTHRDRQPSKKTFFNFDGANLDDCGTYSYLDKSINSNGFLILAMETLFK